MYLVFMYVYHSRIYLLFLYMSPVLISSPFPYMSQVSIYISNSYISLVPVYILVLLCTSSLHICSLSLCVYSVSVYVFCLSVYSHIYNYLYVPLFVYIPPYYLTQFTHFDYSNVVNPNWINAVT